MSDTDNEVDGAPSFTEYFNLPPGSNKDSDIEEIKVSFVWSKKCGYAYDNLGFSTDTGLYVKPSNELIKSITEIIEKSQHEFTVLFSTLETKKETETEE